MRVLVAVALAIAASSSVAQAQSYPSRPITMIVPVAPGGSTDIVGRVVAERMKVTLGSAGDRRKRDRRRRHHGRHAAPPLAARRLHDPAVGQWSSHVGAAVIYAPPFDYLTDFEPIARLSIGAIWVMGRKDFPAKDAKELVAWLKANPGKATAGTVGAGSGAHLCMLYLTGVIGSSVQFVPYRGGAPGDAGCGERRNRPRLPGSGPDAVTHGSGLIKPYAVARRQALVQGP